VHHILLCPKCEFRVCVGTRHARSSGAFIEPYIPSRISPQDPERKYANKKALRERFLREYLAAHPPHGEVRIRPGAWNTGWHHGAGFTQSTASAPQRDALERVRRVSTHMHAAARGPQREARPRPRRR
jgi:hypothetical protein